MQDLKNYQGEDQVVDSHTYYEIVKKMPVEPKIPFGIKTLDFLTEGGFSLGNLITVSGYTGFGKTTLCQTISYNIAAEGVQSLWLSYELTPRQFFNKYQEGQVPLFYMPKKNVLYDLFWVKEKIQETKAKFGVQVVFIDHLHYVVPMSTGAGEKKQELIGDAMRSLKQMAVQNNVAIFLMAHTKQPKGEAAPVIADLRDSSFVGQESDVVLMMHRPNKRGKPDEYEDHGILNLLKLRDGGTTGKIKVNIYKKMFHEIVSSEDERAL